MEQNDLDKLLSLRKTLIEKFERLRDYKTNENALMKEVDHAKFVHKTITMIDDILREHVNFS
jgi:hypothetical protein